MSVFGNSELSEILLLNDNAEVKAVALLKLAFKKDKENPKKFLESLLEKIPPIVQFENQLMPRQLEAIGLWEKDPKKRAMFIKNIIHEMNNCLTTFGGSKLIIENAIKKLEGAD